MMLLESLNQFSLNATVGRLCLFLFLGCFWRSIWLCGAKQVTMVKMFYPSQLLCLLEMTGQRFKELLKGECEECGSSFGGQ